MANKNRRARRQRIKERNEAKKMGLVESIGDHNRRTVESIAKSAATQQTTTAAGKSGIHTHQNYIVDDYHKKFCDHYPRRVVDLGELTLYGATKSKLEYDTLQGIDLVLNVSGTGITGLTANANSLVRGGSEFDELKKLIKPIRELILDWADGGIFPATLEFWRKLYDICLANNYKKLVATCLGGHGRTGTALASLLIANTELTAREAVSQIRGIYCNQAVETWSQDEYLKFLETERDCHIETRRNFNIKWSISRFELSQKLAAIEAEKKAAAPKTADTTQVEKCFCHHSKFAHSHLNPEQIPGHCLFSGCHCTVFMKAGYMEQTVIPAETPSAAEAYAIGVQAAQNNPWKEVCLCTGDYVCIECQEKGVPVNDPMVPDYECLCDPDYVCRGCRKQGVPESAPKEQIDASGTRWRFDEGLQTWVEDAFNTADYAHDKQIESSVDVLSDDPATVNASVLESVKRWVSKKGKGE